MLLKPWHGIENTMHVVVQLCIHGLNESISVTGIFVAVELAEVLLAFSLGRIQGSDSTLTDQMCFTSVPKLQQCTIL